MTPVPISKFVSTSTLKDIASGFQKKIVKLNCDWWRHDVIPKETRIIFTDGFNDIEVEIVNKSYFQSFGDAWFIHGDEIHPGLTDITTIEHANRFFFSKGYKEEDVSMHGVIVVEFKPVEM
jgi:hypothetical protein